MSSSLRDPGPLDTPEDQSPNLIDEACNHAYALGLNRQKRGRLPPDLDADDYRQTAAQVALENAKKGGEFASMPLKEAKRKIATKTDNQLLQTSRQRKVRDKKPKLTGQRPRLYRKQEAKVPEQEDERSSRENHLRALRHDVKEVVRKLTDAQRAVAVELRAGNSHVAIQKRLEMTRTEFDKIHRQLRKTFAPLYIYLDES